MSLTRYRVFFCGLWLGGLLLMMTTGCSAATQSATTIAEGITEGIANEIAEEIAIAWVSSGDLFLWRSGDAAPTPITSGGVGRAHLSPDAQYIAFTRSQHQTSLSATLWLIKSDGTAEQQITAAPPHIHQMAWADANTLLFNTAALDDLGAVPRDDLYRLDVISGQPEALPIGGQFGISPDATQVIAISAGRYQQAEAQIQHLNLYTGAAQTLLRFPAVATGSHTRFYPQIQWDAHNSALVALPDADALYQEASPTPPPVTLWRLRPDVPAEQVAGINASFFGLPVAAPITGRLAYFQRSATDPNRYALYVSDADGRGAALYAGVDNSIPVGWLPDGERFIYVNEAAYWVGQAGAAPRPWLALNPGVVMQPTLLNQGILYITLQGDGLELRYAAFDAAAWVRVAALGASMPRFDAVSLPGSE